MGLGKTLTALLAARALMRCAELRLLVVAPVGLHPHWRRESEILGVELELASWARLPDTLPPAGTLLVVDEAHYAQSLQAQRIRARAANRAVRVFPSPISSARTAPRRARSQRTPER